MSQVTTDPVQVVESILARKVEGDHRLWQERAHGLLRAVTNALIELRDTRGRELSIASLIEHLSLTKIEELYLMGHERALANNGAWPAGFDGIKNYLETGLPGFKTDKLLNAHGLLKAEQPHDKELSQIAGEHHEYFLSQLIRPLADAQLIEETP